MNLRKYDNKRIHWAGCDFKVIGLQVVDTGTPQPTYRARVRSIDAGAAGTATINFKSLDALEAARSAYETKTK